MKAYERSAFFAHTQIHEFKLSKRYIKTVNMDVISLGFPEQTIPKWLNGYVYEWVQEGLLRCHMRKKFDEVEFHNWKEVVSVNVGDRFTPFIVNFYPSVCNFTNISIRRSSPPDSVHLPIKTSHYIQEHK